MNERIRELVEQSGISLYKKDVLDKHFPELYDSVYCESSVEQLEKFAELIVQEYVSEYNKLINGEAVVLPKDREHAEALVRVGMFYLENNK